MKRFLTTACMVALALGSLGQGEVQGNGAGPGMRRSALRNMRSGMARSGMARSGAQQAGQQQDPSADEAKEAIKNAPKGTNGIPALVFNQAPLELVLDAYAEQCGKTIIPAPDLPKVTITLKSLEGQTLTKEEYLGAIEVALRKNGVVLEGFDDAPFKDKFLQALQYKTLRTQGNPLLLDMPDKPLREQGRVVSQMIHLTNITAEEAQKAIEGFKDPNGLLQVFERSNTILVTDTQENINRMLAIIKTLDVSVPVTEDVFVRQIEYAVAADIKTALETIVTESQKETGSAEKAGTKTSGSLGFGRTAASTPQPGRLLNLNNRPGLQKQEPPVNTPNANLVAAVSDADRGMIRGKVLILADERSNKLIVITNKSNMDFFDKVITTLDVETTPEVQIDVIRLKFADSEDVASMLNDLIGASGGSSSQAKNNQNANTQRGGTANSNLTRGTAQQPAAQRRVGASNNPTFQNANASRLGELNRDNVKVLSDKRINGIVVMARKADMRAIKDVIENMDVKLSQVLIETVIVEIQLGDDLKTGIDWVQRGKYKTMERRQMTDEYGRNLYWDEVENDDGDGTRMVPTTTLTDNPIYEWVTKTERTGFYNRGNDRAGYMLGGGGGKDKAMLQSLFGAVGTNAVDMALGANPIGSGINYFLKSDKLNLAAIIEASKSDSRAKYIASPIVMTVDNKEATIEATESRKFYSGSSVVSSGYNPTTSYNYSDKDIGIKIKITPKINPNGTVMLTIEEEYSQLGNGQDVLVSSSSGAASSEHIDTAVERKMSADIRLENMQTVVLGGLTETMTKESETGIPVLKDIPWIGKWLFGKVEQNETRRELLVFMTPYVLDDDEAAQLEAFRRKKALSDPRPWDDHGWSASPLADPVSRKEQLRRFKEEWEKQDEERKTKLAIEKAKMERARKLEKMSEEERKAWLEVHKEEMEKEEKEAFEKQVEEQENLKEFVDELKKKDMEKAEKAVKEADAAAVRDNEYNKFIKEQQENGKPLPPGETLKKDAEALKNAEAAGGERARATEAGEGKSQFAATADAQNSDSPAPNGPLVPDAKPGVQEPPKKDK